MAKCAFCKKQFTQFNSLNKVCSISCAIELGKLKPAKVNYKRVNSQLKSEAKEKLLTLSDYQRLLQKEINQICRHLDRNSVCISSLRKLNEKFDAGHRFSIGGYANLRFNLHNIHAQSVHENQHKSGNPDGYDYGLEHLYGLDYLNFVHTLKKEPLLKLNKNDLIELIKRSRIIKRGILKIDKEFTPDERIQFRNAINTHLGIYKLIYIPKNKFIDYKTLLTEKKYKPINT